MLCTISNGEVASKNVSILNRGSFLFFSETRKVVTNEEIQKLAKMHAQKWRETVRVQADTIIPRIANTSVSGEKSKYNFSNSGEDEDLCMCLHC